MLSREVAPGIHRVEGDMGLALRLKDLVR